MWLVALAVGSAGVVALAWWLRARYVIVTVQGRSMRPALNSGDRVLVRRCTVSSLQTGQVIVLERPNRRDGAWHWRLPEGRVTARKWMIKRVAALPGEPVPTPLHDMTTEEHVPDGLIAVLGDNTAESIDSRELGFIPAERVLGVALRGMGRRRRVRTEDTRPVDELVRRLPADGPYSFRVKGPA